MEQQTKERKCMDCGSTTTYTHFSEKKQRLETHWFKAGLTKYRCDKCQKKFLYYNLTEDQRKEEVRKAKMTRRKQHNRWGSVEQWSVFNNTQIVIDSENFCAQKILPKNGYYDIVLTRPYSEFFFCDILARNSEGKKYAIDVTLAPKKDVNLKKSELIKWMELGYMVIHIRPDFGFYYINDIKEKRYSSAVVPHNIFVTGKGYKTFLDNNR